MIRTAPLWLLLACNSGGDKPAGNGGSDTSVPPTSVAPGTTTTPPVELCNGQDDDGDGVVDVGVDGGACSEVFDVTRALDLLLVIDNSCSMSEEQAALANNGAAFLQRLDDRGLDFHIGVVTTDMFDPAHGGRLIEVNSQRWIGSVAEGPTLAQMIQAGTGGSATEKAFDAAHAALGVHAAPGEPNDGFVRTDADLGVLFLADESDFSTDVDRIGLRDELAAYKTGDAVVSAHSFVTPAVVCPSASTPGDDYRWLTMQLGGIEHDVCDAANFDLALSDVADHHAVGNDTFVLSVDPDPAWLSVTVDAGGSLTEYATSELTWDAATLTLTLPAPAPAGAIVSVHYGPVL